MTKERYVKEVLNLLKCSNSKKKEIGDKLILEMNSAQKMARTWNR